MDIFFTKDGRRVAKLIRGLGFTVEEEKILGGKVLDIYLPEFHMAVELDGVFHFKKKDKERDKYLLDNFRIRTLRYASGISNKEFIKKFLEEIGKNMASDAFSEVKSKEGQRDKRIE